MGSHQHTFPKAGSAASPLGPHLVREAEGRRETWIHAERKEGASISLEEIKSRSPRIQEAPHFAPVAKPLTGFARFSK